MQWSTACPDWEERIVKGESLVPFKPLFPDYADEALEVFKKLRIIDLPGHPTFGDACDQWVFDYIGAIFGAYDPDTGQRHINDFFFLISKKNGKSTITAGIAVTALVLNWRHMAEITVIAPSMEVADNVFDPALGMIQLDPDLSDLLHPIVNQRTIRHRVNQAELKVVAADSDTLSGKKSSITIIEELWQFGKKAKAAAMLREAVGGLVSRPEGFVLKISTHSDEEPAGVFKETLDYFREVRDGTIVDPHSFGILYEFPSWMIDADAHRDPGNWYITNPNLNRSVSSEWLEQEFRKAERAGKESGALQIFLAKHLNVEIGLRMARDRWRGADHWEPVEEVFTLEELLERCEVVTAGGDGGGLDDLLGLYVIGREIGTGRWLGWGRAWVQRDVLNLRQEIAPRLEDFANAGELMICDDVGHDIEDFADHIAKIWESDLFPEKAGIGLDPVGVAALIDAIVARDVPQDVIVGVPQGYRLSGAINGAARNLKARTLIPAKQALMRWCVGNAKSERRGNAIYVTKQASGTAKIDPLIGLFNAFDLMSRHPEAASNAVTPWDADPNFSIMAA